MSRNIYYDDVKIIKKSIKSRLFLGLKIFLFFLVIGGVFFISIGISDALAVGNISNYLVYGDRNISRDKHSYYAITLGCYDTYIKAQEVGLGANVQGASGYVWQDEKFYVVGNIYKSYDDAMLVKDNLKGTKYDIQIKEISFPAVKLSFTDRENKQVNDIRNAIDFVSDVYDVIYNYSILFDKKEITHLAVSAGVSELRGKCKEHINILQTILSVPNENIQTIQNNLLKLDTLLDQTILLALDNSGVNYALKNSLTKVVRIKYDMFTALV